MYFLAKNLFMQGCDVCIDTIGSVVHDSANIEIMQSKFIDCMWFKKTPSNIAVNP